MRQPLYTIGVDFGTLSARAVVVDTSNGQIAVQAEALYAHGVISDRLPDGGAVLPPQWALQVPADYLEALETSVVTALRQSAIPSETIVGITCDFTSCTVLPTTCNGTALCQLTPYRNTPHAYAKLWKHHAAQDQARQIEQLAQAQNPSLLRRYGGRVSSEWLLPKALQILQEAPALAADADLLLEAADWISFCLTGRLCRSVCCAGFKRFWSPELGDVSPAFLAALDSRMPAWMERALRGDLRRVWEPVGHLTPFWAQKLGLSPKTTVGVGIIDAHAALLGSGITESGNALLILGTSACQLLLDQRSVAVPGICGNVRDAVLPGLETYEAGQPCVGDLLAWFTQQCVPAVYADEAKRQKLTIHQLLTQRAAKLSPGESGLLALDWWNGQRTPLVNDELSGVMLGMTLQTRPEEQYRALIESVAFGTRLIFDTLQAAGLQVGEITVCGGIARKNPLMMQIYADVLNRPIRVAHSEESSALGCAILAAVASGIYPTVVEAARAMTQEGQIIYQPNWAHVAVYEQLFQLYKEVSAYFGRSSPAMKELLNIRKQLL